MQQQTDSFKEDFSKSIFYRFPNSAKSNWLRLTFLLASDIVNNDLNLADDKRKIIIDNSLFNRTICKKTAHVAIMFTRYMLFAMEQRQNEDQRTLGELFFFLVDEMADITFSRSLGILMDALMASF